MEQEKIYNNTNVNLKQTKLKLVLFVILIAGIVLFSKGIRYYIPNQEITSAKEYVGGDAYNYYIMAASIKGGEISGAETSKTIYICSGVLLISYSLIKLIENSD